MSIGWFIKLYNLYCGITNSWYLIYLLKAQKNIMFSYLFMNFFNVRYLYKILKFTIELKFNIVKASPLLLFSKNIYVIT